MTTAPLRQPAAKPDRIDPITTSVIQGALENIAVEMGYKLMRMSYSSIIRESEDFGAALVDAEGRGLAESAQSTPLQSGPIPGYVRGVLKNPGRARRSVPAGRRDHAQRRLFRRKPRPGRRLHRAGVRPGQADRLCRHHGASPRHRRAVAGLVRHRRGDRRLCRGPAVQGDQGLRPRCEERHGLADRARQHPRLRPRGRRHGRPGRRRPHRRRAHGRAGRALWPGNLRPRLHRPDGPCRAADAPGHRQAARRRLSRRDGDRRLSRQRRSGQEGAADRRHHHQEGRLPRGRPHRHRAAGARPADQHAARRHRRHRDLAHHPLGAARHARSTATSRSMPG